MSTLIWRYVRQFVKMDAKEAVQYVSTICLSADQGNGVGKEQVETAWDLVRRIIVLANPGAAWEELVGGFRPDGTRFVSSPYNTYWRDNHSFWRFDRAASLSNARPFSNSPISKITTTKSSFVLHKVRKKIRAQLKPSSCTTLRVTITPSFHVSLVPWVTRLHCRTPMKRQEISRGLPVRY